MVRTERPETLAELAALMGEAHQGSLAVVPRGGGRAFGAGRPVERCDLLLETTALARILDRSQADMTVRVEAGITLEALDESLQEVGQFLPLDPFNAPGHTVGGALASGWTGPLRLAYGGPRDYLIGLKVIAPDGRVTRSGGQVVKNVSGYDMKKLHLGAMGSLGVIVEASFKVFPRPTFETTVQNQTTTLAAAMAQAERALGLPMRPLAVEMVAEAGDFKMVARLAGWPKAVARMQGELGWEVLDDAFWKRHSSRSSPCWARISVPPSRIAELLPKLPESGWSCSVGVGSVQWLEADDAEAVLSVREVAESLGGHLVLLAASETMRKQVDAFGKSSPGAQLMRRVREAHDPLRIMAPGRFAV